MAAAVDCDSPVLPPLSDDEEKPLMEALKVGAAKLSSRTPSEGDLWEVSDTVVLPPSPAASSSSTFSTAASIAPTCVTCKQVVDPMVDIASSRHTWRCQKCNSRRVSLTRIFGSWPTAEFKSLSESEQTLWYTKLAARPAKSGTLKDWAIDSLTTILAEKTTHTKGGSWQPLSYYQQLGYDIAAIEQHAPRKQHAIFGDVFLIEVESVSLSKSTEQIRQQLVQRSTTRRCTDGGQEGDEQPPNKKAKHGLGAVAAKAEMEAEKANKIKLRNSRKAAGTFFNKIAACAVQLTAQLGHPAAKNYSSYKSALQTEAEITRLRRVVESNMTATSVGGLTEVTSQEVSQVTSACKEHIAVMSVELKIA